MDALQWVLSVASGGLVGLILGLIGGGGSILALPLLVYVVGYAGDPHTAIGTTALAVAASAVANAIQHQRRGAVRLEAGIPLALAGVPGALVGAWLGLRTPGQHLLFLFALLMLVVAYRMWRSKPVEAPEERPMRGRVLRLALAGFLVGTLSGYFGIGGGFLIVPALLWAGGLTVREAVGTSLLAVATFGFTTAARYGFAGKLDLPVAALFIVGGLVGSFAGTALSHRVSTDGLRRGFALALVVVAVYIAYRSLRVLT